MIVVDYIGLLKSAGKSFSREQEIAKISEALKDLAQELEIPVIALSQLSREATKSVTWDNGPTSAALRESGSLEQDADVIILGHEATETEVNQNPDLEGKRRWRIVKQRNGVQFSIELDFKNEIQLFEAIEKTFPTKGNFVPKDNDFF